MIAVTLDAYRRRLSIALGIGLLCFGRMALAADAPAGYRPIDIASDHAYGHIIGWRHVVQTAEAVDPETSISIETVVGPDGVVVSARALDGPAALRELAESAAFRDVYSPFTVNGAPATVRFTYRSPVFRESLPTVHVPFPDVRTPSDVSMTLATGGCLGTCPIYTVRIDGDGTTSFTGSAFVAAIGTFTYRIDPAAAAALVDRFRASDFFSLSDKYMGMMDGGSFTLAISVGRRAKSVFSEGGLWAGMPDDLIDIYVEIDRVADTARFIDGSPATVEMMKAQGFDFASAAGAHLLANATECCSHGYFTALLDAGVPLSGRDHSGTTLAERAVFSDRLKGRALLEAVVARGTAAERSEASIAAMYQDWALARALVEATPEPADINARSGPDGETALQIMARYGLHDAVRFLLDLGADPGATDPKGATALQYAGDAETVRLLVAAGLDPAARDAHGNTPLHLASGGPAVQALIDLGADIEARNDAGRTPLLTHARDEAAALVLLEAGADARACDDAGRTALHGLRRVRDPAVAQALVDRGADPNARDARGRTPLLEVDQPAVVAVLIAAGADPDAASDDGDTPLHVVWDNDVARMLIAAGANVNARNARGETPLMLVRYPSTARLLLEAGADAAMRDAEGRSALDRMRAAGREDIAAVLGTAGAP
jgi:ankyrin repeat protein